MAKQVYNRFFDKEKWDKVNKWNKNALEDFNLELKSQRKSPQTIKQYNNDIFWLDTIELKYAERFNIYNNELQHLKDKLKLINYCINVVFY